MNVVLGKNCVANYLTDFEQINEFPKDLQIQSADGTKFFFNRLLLMSCSQLISNILMSLDQFVLQKKIIIYTNLSSNVLEQLELLTTQGILTLHDDVQALIGDQDLIESFETLGVDLKKLQFTSWPYETPMPIHPDVILVKNEQDSNDVPNEQDVNNVTSDHDSCDVTSKRNSSLKRKPESKLKAAEHQHEGIQRDPKRKAPPNKPIIVTVSYKDEEFIDFDESDPDFDSEAIANNGSTKFESQEVAKKRRKSKFEARTYKYGLLDRSEDGKRWKCQKCNDQFYQFREVLLKHILDVHSAETYHCEFCNKTFSGLKYGSLIRHHAAHLKFTSLQCVVCGLEVKNLAQLELHMSENDHNDLCAICQKKLESWNEHQKHLKAEHTDDKSGTEFIPEYLLRADPVDVVVPCQVTLGSSAVHEDVVPDQVVKDEPHTARQERKPKSYTSVDGQKVVKKRRTKKGEGRSYVIGLLDRSADNSGWKCQKCGDEFYKIREVLVNHIAEEHGNETYFCPFCPKTFSGLKYSSFIRHHSSHVKSSTATLCHCIACGLGCKTPTLLESHKRGKGPYHNDLCVTCHKKLGSWEEHQNHINEEHEGVRKYRCGKCGNIFSTVLNLRAHQVEAHTGESFTVCFDCGQTVSSMTRHRQRYHSNEEHQCPYCPKVLSHKSVLKIHIESSHLNMQCHDCGKIMKSKKKFKYHVMANHTPVHQRPYVCQICPDKGFAGLKPYREHMNIHSGEKPNKCKFCEACFSHTANMYAHMKICKKDETADKPKPKKRNPRPKPTPKKKILGKSMPVGL